MKFGNIRRKESKLVRRVFLASRAYVTYNIYLCAAALYVCINMEISWE